MQERPRKQEGRREPEGPRTRAKCGGPSEVWWIEEARSTEKAEEEQGPEDPSKVRRTKQGLVARGSRRDLAGRGSIREHKGPVDHGSTGGPCMSGGPKKHMGSETCGIGQDKRAKRMRQEDRTGKQNQKRTKNWEETGVSKIGRHSQRLMPEIAQIKPLHCLHPRRSPK